MRETTRLEILLGQPLETARTLAANEGYTVRAIEQTEFVNEYLITADYDERRVNVLTHAGMVVSIESIG